MHMFVRQCKAKTSSSLVKITSRFQKVSKNSLLVSLLCREREESSLIRPVTMNGRESGE